MSKKARLSVEVLKDFHQYKKGDKREFQASTARELAKGGFVKLDEKSDEDLSLKELREKYPEIEAKTKAKFLEALNG